MKNVIITTVSEVETISYGQYEKNGFMKTIERYIPIKCLKDSNGIIITNANSSELLNAIQSFPNGTQLKLTLAISN